MSETERPPIASPTAEPAEEVLVLPRALLEREGLLAHGFTRTGVGKLLDLAARYGTFRDRKEVEEDPSLKQIIPYGVVRRGGKVLLLRRTARGGEARLHGKLSIGAGGHINPGPAPPERRVHHGLLRELEEELRFASPYACEPLGLINDDRSAVGSVHLGVVFAVLPSDLDVEVRESDVLEGRFVEAEELGPLLPSLESWSRLVAEELFPAAGGS